MRYARPRKFINALKLVLSFYLSRGMGRVFVWGRPMTIAIEPTTACNLKCPECPSGLRAFSRPTGNLKQDFFRQTIDKQYRDLIFLIFYFQGEPYINPGFLDMVRYAHEKHIYTMSSTNGHFLDDDRCKATIASGLDRLVISIDGLTQDTYAAYRKEGRLEKVIDGARRLVYWRKKLGAHHPRIVFQVLAVRPNEHEIPGIHALAKEIGIDEVKVKTAQIYDYRNGHPLIPENPAYSRYRKKPDGSYEIKNSLKNACWKMWHSCVVTWDGQVVPCCFDKDAQHTMGQLTEKSLDNIWAHDRYADFRKKVFKDRKNIDICQNCTEGCEVWA